MRIAVVGTSGSGKTGTNEHLGRPREVDAESIPNAARYLSAFVVPLV